MNAFLLFNEKQLDVPRRVYARLGEVESTNEEQFSRQMLFEAVDASWYDEYSTSDITRDEFFQNIPISVVQVDIYRDASHLKDNIFFLWVSRNQSYINLENIWIEIELTEDRKGAPALIYTGLFSPPNERSVKNVRIASDELCMELKKDFSLDDIEDTNENELRTYLDQINDISFAAVYDVGQGNCNGLCSTNGSVQCYFDFGGGVLRNRHTYPNQLKHFCYTNNPPIILSHWDWDHWSSGTRDPLAFNQTWIVPRQSLGAVHRTFAHNIYKNGQLLVWPDTLREITVGQVTVMKCTGQGRNHSGLALILYEHKNKKGKKMLFTGDARYNVIPFPKTLEFTNIVVPHHGADMKNQFAPDRPNYPHTRLAYSYGYRNSYNHPRQVTRKNHDNHGWLDNVISPGVSKSYNVETGSSTSGTPQHIMLRWNSKQQLLGLPCNGKCDLRLRKK